MRDLVESVKNSEVARTLSSSWRSVIQDPAKTLNPVEAIKDSLTSTFKADKVQESKELNRAGG